MSSRRNPTRPVGRRTTNVVRLMFFCQDIFRDRLLAKLKHNGYASIRWSDGIVLRYVGRKGTTLTEVTRRAGVSKQAVAKIASELATSGYLKIIPNIKDRRAKIVRLTAKGLILAAVIKSVNEEVEREIASEIGRHKLKDFRTTLIDLVNAELPPP